VTTLRGGCHCGAISVELTTPRRAEELAIRECQCRFCRRHGARGLTDREGHVTIRGHAGDVTRFRFALATADFLICRRCGVYVAAVIEAEGRAFATINARTLGDLFPQRATAVDYSAESADERRARRIAGWTPTELALT
jgi:hypothetical protein